jgi:hypothetical protein
MKTHAKSEGAIEKKLVQDGAAESAAVSAEDSLGGCATTQEANAME